ncbi:hypothetical protein HZA44_00385 [Candidatus Peregrinibacteria bacterium]|nr:hypothetical protein [Candidatus Peregrinibacteria bacterium]
MKPPLTAQEIQTNMDLNKQEKVIMSVLLYGNPEEQLRLDKAYNDPDLHLATKGLIDKCRRKLHHYVKREENPMSMPVKVQL